MTITITDNRILVDEADALTDWSSPVGGETLEIFTSTPDPKEDSGHIGMAISEEEGEVLHTLASGVDLSGGVLIYVWALVNGSVDPTSSYGMSMVIGDGTNTNAYQVCGADKAVFRHYSGQPNYQCMLLDTGNLPSGKALRGTFGNLDLSGITEFGANYNVSSKALGGADNCFTDIIWYGNSGITITGSDSAYGWLYDLAELDAGDSSLEAYGICRNLGGEVYGIQGQIFLGDTGTGDDNLKMVDQTFKFENFSNVGTDKFGITIQGGSGSSNIDFTNSILFCPAGTGAFLNAVETDIEDFDMVGCVVFNFDQNIGFTADVTNGPNWDISGNRFVGCAQINIGKTAFKDNCIDSTTDALGGMIIDSDTSLANVEGLQFISDGTGHAIYITATGSYTFTNFTYEGYGASHTTDAVIYNNSGGSVTITVSGGDTPTYRNGSGADTTIISQKTYELTDLKENSNVLLLRQDDNSVIDEVENSGTSYQYQYTWSEDIDIFVVIHHVNYNYIRFSDKLEDADKSTKVFQQTDRWYDNPS